MNGEGKEQAKKPARTVGRPRTPQEIRELVVRIATETGWGYSRVLGELKKLGVRTISRQTVKNILKEHGLDPGPKRGQGSWDEFLRIHASTLGLLDMYLLIFIHVGTRRVWISSATAHPNSAWVAQQARNFCMEFCGTELNPTIVMHDSDTKFTAQFDAILKSEGIRAKKLTPASPNLNAYVERLVQSLQQEALDHFAVLGERHLNYLAREFVAHYHTERCHQGVRNLPPAVARPPDTCDSVEGIVRRERLGGLLKWYERRAA